MNVRGHSKSTFARNFQFLIPPPTCSFLFVLHVPAPSTYVIPPPFPHKSSTTLMTLISNKILFVKST